MTAAFDSRSASIAVRSFADLKPVRRALAEAAALLADSTTDDELDTFITLPAYDLLP